MTSTFPRWHGDASAPFVLHLAQDLQREGWRVDVLAPGAPGAAKSEWLDGILVERFPYLWPPSSQTVCYGGGALVNLRGSPLNKAKVPALVLAELAATLRRLRSRPYQLLHSHWILPQGFTGAVVARALRRPHVLTAHGGDVFALEGRMLRAFKRYALNGADAVTCNSSATANAVRSIAPQIRDLRVIPMGVDIGVQPRDDTVRAIRARYARGRGPLVLFVGRLVEEKGVGDLIRAIPTASKRLPDMTCVIVGDGQHRSRFEELTKDLAVTDRVSFAGWVAGTDVRNFLAASDVLAAPSRRAPDGWVEAQGVSIVEGMASGVPVVGTLNGGIPDVISDGRTGLLIPEGDPTALARAIERIASDQSLAEALGREGRKVAEARFSRAASAAAFSALFEGLLGTRRKVKWGVSQESRKSGS